ncbi:MAG: class II aldolase/adducin family protein [Sneathiellaceae bacterium]
MSQAALVQTPGVRETVSPEEWKMRVDLAACYRLVAHFGWDDLIFTHISARVPGPEHHFLINPYGMMFDEITASSLVKVDMDANIVMDSPYGMNPAGFTIHSAIHAARPEVMCVLHVHTDDGVAVSCMEEGLMPLNQLSLAVRGDIAYHDYEGIALNWDERERLVADLGDKGMMILRSHGTLSCATSVARTFLQIYFLERACTTQIRALTGGRKLVVPPQEVQDVVTQQAQGIGMTANLAWGALLRMLDRKNPGYAD